MLKSSFRVFLLLFSTAFLVYSPALGGEFLWDDLTLVGDNPFFKSPIFVLEVFRHTLFPGFFSPYYRPVQNLSYMVDYWIWNKNSFGYHLSNVFFHAASAFLLFLLLKRLLPLLVAPRDAVSRQADPVNSVLPAKTHGTNGNDGPYDPCPVNTQAIALFVALIWVIHPIHNAAVAYVAGRADSLASFFSLGAWLLWLCIGSTGSRTKRCLAGAASLVLVLLALCSKEIALVWIILFLFHLFTFDHKQPLRSKAAVCGAILLALVGYWVLRHLPEKEMALSGMTPPQFEVRVIFALRALGDYTGLIFFPLHLQMERAIFNAGAYFSPGAWRENIGLEYLSTFGLLTVIAALFLCRKKWAGQRVRIFGAIWFLIGFLPISNLFPLNAQSAEHWIYMPSIGFLVFLAGCYLAVPQKQARWLFVPVCVAIVLLGVRTWVRSGDWISPEVFYSRTFRSGGGTCRICLNLSEVYAQQPGGLPKAEELLRDTVRRYPSQTIARIYLGKILMREGKTEEAESYLSFDKSASDRIAHEFPKTWKAAQSLAEMKKASGKTDEALAIVNEALIRYGDVWELSALKAQLIQKKEGARAAIPIMQAFADTHWWHYGAFLVLARLHQKVGEIEPALAALRHARWLDIHEAEPLSMAAQIELDRHNFQAACDLQKIAIRRDPGDMNQTYLLGKIFEKLGRKQEAHDAFKKVLDSADPN